MTIHGHTLAEWAGALVFLSLAAVIAWPIVAGKIWRPRRKGKR